MKQYDPRKLKVKKLDPEAVLPSKAKEGDAGYDCVALDDGIWSKDKTYIEYRTGLAIEVPPGYHTELFPRSSISKYDLVLANSIGLVDNGYRGELLFRFKVVQKVLEAKDQPAFRLTIPVMWEPVLYKKGDKIGQIVIRETLDFEVEEVDVLSDTARGSGGFGSSGQ